MDYRDEEFIKQRARVNATIDEATGTTAEQRRAELDRKIDAAMKVPVKSYTPEWKEMVTCPIQTQDLSDQTTIIVQPEASRAAVQHWIQALNELRNKPKPNGQVKPSAP